MTKKEIKDGNNLIAEFIGVDITYSETEYRDSKSVLRDKIDHYPKSEELKFHSSWDWLMAAVEKIITSYFDKRESIFSGLTEVNIEKTFVAVVKFIEFWNDDSQPKLTWNK